MKRIFIGLLFGLMVVTGSAFATVVCDDGITGCQFPDSVTQGYQPGVLFNLATDQQVSILGNVYGTPDCSGDAQVVTGVLPLMAGPNIVFLRFDPALDPGTVLSMTWKVGGCDLTDCITYTIGDQDQLCPAGAGVHMSTLDASNLQ